MRNVALAVLFATAAPAVAAAAVTMPTCDAIAAYVAQADLKAIWKVGNQELAEAVHGPKFEALFGASALDFTPKDVKEATAAVWNCSKVLKRAKQVKPSQRVAFFGKEVRYIAHVNALIARGEKVFDKHFKSLMDGKQDRNQLAALMVLDKARAGGPAVKEARAYRDKFSDSNDNKQIGGTAGGAMNQLLSDMSDADHILGDRMYPALTERRDKLVGVVTDQEIARIDAVPETVAGLKSLVALRRDVDRDVKLILPPESYAKVAAAFDAHETETQDKIAATVAKDIADATVDGNGLGLLQAIDQSDVVAALSADRAQELHAKVAARKEEVLGGMIDAATGHLATFPDDFDGMSSLVEFIKQVRGGGLEQAAGPERTKIFESAANARATALSNAALPDFKARLAKLSEDRRGLDGLHRLVMQMNGVLAAMQPVTEKAYQQAAGDRGTAITAAIAKQDAAAEALPLAGAVYADQGHNMAVRFDDGRHATLAVMGQPMPLDYTVDGKRVTLHGTPQGDLILERHGPALDGFNLHFVRQGA